MQRAGKEIEKQKGRVTEREKQGIAGKTSGREHAPQNLTKLKIQHEPKKQNTHSTAQYEKLDMACNGNMNVSTTTVAMACLAPRTAGEWTSARSRVADTTVEV